MGYWGGLDCIACFDEIGPEDLCTCNCEDSRNTGPEDGQAHHTDCHGQWQADQHDMGHGCIQGNPRAEDVTCAVCINGPRRR